MDVLNLGQVTFDGPIADVSAGRLIHLMAGFTESSDDAEVTPRVPATRQ